MINELMLVSETERNLDWLKTSLQEAIQGKRILI